METLKEINNLYKIFRLYPKIKLVYLFGSRVNGKICPSSDYDFAVYLDEKDPQTRFDLKLELLGKITTALKTDAVDLCILNDLHSPGLKYHIVKDGRVMYEKEPFKLLIEPRIFNEFFDFRQSLIEHKLTKMR